jgi:hypothetical protein
MGIASAITGGIGAATGIVSAISEGKNKKKIAREIANQKAVPLTNVADGLQVSTRGADLQKEEQARLAATQTAALQDAGSRALVGGIGKVSANSNSVNANIAADLDSQQKDISRIGAQDDIRIQTTKDQRAKDKLAALSSQYNAASQNQQMGIGNAISGLGQAANGLSTIKLGGKENEIVDAVSELKPASLAKINSTAKISAPTYKKR